MAKYKCKQLGACEKADSGEIFDISAGADLKCPDCGVMLAPVVNGGIGNKSTSKNALIPVAIAVIAILAGGGYYFTVGRNASAPAETAEVVNLPVPASESKQTTTSGISPTEDEIKAQRLESERKLTSGDAANAEVAGNRAAANELLKIAIAKMTQGKLDEAEKDLLIARERDPKQSLVSYNLAVLRLKQGRKDDAFKEFEASFMAGFNYFDKMDQDPDLLSLRKDENFNALIAQYRKKSATQ